MLYTMKPLLDHALENHYAVMAPSIRNEDCARAAIEVAVEIKSPIILNVNRHAWAGMLDEYYWKYQMEVLRQIAEKASVPVAINLDHSPSFGECAYAIVSGFTSVMTDRSNLPFDQNVAYTAEVVNLAHAVGVSVEAELGHVGIDDPESLRSEAKDGNQAAEDKQTAIMDSESVLTDPDELVKFVELTGVDCVAVSIGNQHGAYKNGRTPKIEFELLERLHAACPKLPLVLHGGSGTGTENLKKACQMAICKVNVGTDCERAAAMALIGSYNDTGKIPAGVYSVMREGYKQEVYRQMEIMGSAGMAW